ncbi:MAG: hypothetical protein ACHREM_01210 [Polyangiales bacterium]
MRDGARAVLSRRCGECHDPARRSALPGALKVFDVTEAGWSARMTDTQLRNALWRLGEPIPPEGRANDVTDAERGIFGRYVGAEIARRATATK